MTSDKDKSPKVVMHKITGELKELTYSWLCKVIWLTEYDFIPESAIAVFPYVIYEDDKRFKQYEVIGEL